MFDINISIDTIDKAWEKALPVAGHNATCLRQDICGAWISRDSYGDHQSQYGWEVIQIVPQDQGGTEGLSNLQPIQWENYNHIADEVECLVKAHEVNNIRVAL